MSEFSQRIIQEYFTASDQATTTVEKGRILENLVCYLFEQVPGIKIGK
jgi:hypothetical protein